MADTCPSCGDKLVRPMGRDRSVFLLVGEAPGIMELNSLKPFVGPTGDVLDQEMRRAGIDTRATRLTNLWQHAIPKGKENAELKQMCFDYMYAQLMEQISTARAIFLMGSELAPLFTGMPVSKINGARVTSKMIDPGIIVVASYNPAIVLQESGVVGDFRFAVESFVSYTKDIYKEMIHGR
jgi:DNA polymerase